MLRSFLFIFILIIPTEVKSETGLLAKVNDPDPLRKGVANMVLNMINSEVFGDYNLDISSSMELMDKVLLLEKSGLSSEQVIKASGMNFDDVTQATKYSMIVIDLIDSGFHFKKAVSIYRISKEINKNSETTTEVLVSALRATKQNPDSLVVDEALKQAKVLTGAGHEVKDILIGAGIDFEKIPDAQLSESTSRIAEETTKVLFHEQLKRMK